MRKEISIILSCLLISAIFSGCGIKGPLTQKPPKQKNIEQKLTESVDAKQTTEQDNSDH